MVAYYRHEKDGWMMRNNGGTKPLQMPLAKDKIVPDESLFIWEEDDEEGKYKLLIYHEDDEDYK